MTISWNYGCLQFIYGSKVGAIWCLTYCSWCLPYVFSKVSVQLFIENLLLAFGVLFYMQHFMCSHPECRHGLDWNKTWLWWGGLWGMHRDDLLLWPKFKEMCVSLSRHTHSDTNRNSFLWILPVLDSFWWFYPIILLQFLLKLSNEAFKNSLTCRIHSTPVCLLEFREFFCPIGLI